MGDQIRQHLQREVTRKEFLQLLAALALSILGIHNFLNIIANGTRQKNLRSSSRGLEGRHGFGSSRFGV